MLMQSRPTGEGIGNYCFAIDAEGHISDRRVGEALMGLKRICPKVRFLGSYPRADVDREGRTARCGRDVRRRVRGGGRLAGALPGRPVLGRLRAYRAQATRGRQPSQATRDVQATQEPQAS